MCVYQTSLHECDQKCLGALPGAYELRTCARAQTQSSVRRVLPDQGWGDGSGPLGDLDTQTGGQHWLLISLLISCMVVSLNIFSRGLGSLHPADKHLHLAAQNHFCTSSPTTTGVSRTTFYHDDTNTQIYRVKTIQALLSHLIKSWHIIVWAVMLEILRL